MRHGARPRPGHPGTRLPPAPSLRMPSPPAGPRRVSAALFGSLALAAAPKCPFCFLALAGLGGSTAAALAPAYARWLLPLTAVLLAATVALLALRRRAGYGPALLAAAASLALLAAKLGDAGTPAVAAAAAALTGAAAWHLRPRRTPAACPCTPSHPSEGPSPHARSGA